MALACDQSMMPTIEAILAVLRRLVWESADILRAYARSEQPPFGYPPALSVDNGGEGPVSAADLAVNQHLLDGFRSNFPDAPWALLSEETAAEQLTAGVPLDAEWLWILDPLMAPRISCRAPASTPCTWR